MNEETKKPNIRPLGDKVLIKPLDPKAEKTTLSGIIIPETVDREKPEQGTVIAVGEGRINENGDVVKMRVKAGDKVIFSKYGPDEVKIDDEEYYILGENSILAVVEGSNSTN